MRERTPLEPLMAELAHDADPTSAVPLARLRESRAVLDFAERAMGLAAGEKYQTYVQLEHPFVLWNVFAAPPLSMEPHRWCYPFVGCGPYRGYFKEHRATAYAARLRERGLETYIGGVPAYSTLGWFSDPLLSSFVFWPDAELAELLIHELAHSKVWARSDVAFNEAFATFVGEQGAREYLAGRGLATPPETGWNALLQLLLDVRAALQQVYAAPGSTEAKLAAKEQALAALRDCYQQNIAQLGAGRFDALVATLNNAYLVSLSTYRTDVPAFAQLFVEHGGAWPEFFAAVDELVALPQAQRRERLASLRQHHEANRADDQRAQHVQCEAFARHSLDGESAGAEHDHVGGGRYR